MIRLKRNTRQVNLAINQTSIISRILIISISYLISYFPTTKLGHICVSFEEKFLGFLMIRKLMVFVVVSHMSRLQNSFCFLWVFRNENFLEFIKRFECFNGLDLTVGNFL